MALLDRNPTEMEAVPYIKKTKDKNVIDKVILQQKTCLRGLRENKMELHLTDI